MEDLCIDQGSTQNRGMMKTQKMEAFEPSPCLIVSIHTCLFQLRHNFGQILLIDFEQIKTYFSQASHLSG